jgi:protein gp37
MGKDSGIQWTDHTFNPWRGCTRVSAGCTNCYAETLSRRNPATLGVWGPSGTRVVASEAMWGQPLEWDREAREAGELRRVFCASLADVFEDWMGPMITSKGLPYWWCHGSLSNSPIPSTGLDDRCRMGNMDDIRDRLLQTIEDTPHLFWLLLTKRPENVGPILDRMGRALPANVWQGTTVENLQAKARIDLLREIKAGIRFLSIEPQIEDLGELDLRGIDWVIVGGESGHQARPFDLAWARSIRDQCVAAGVACFVKQVGVNPIGKWFGDGRDIDWDFPVLNKLKDSHGGDWEEWPADLRVREFPALKVVA